MKFEQKDQLSRASWSFCTGSIMTVLIVKGLYSTTRQSNFATAGERLATRLLSDVWYYRAGDSPKPIEFDIEARRIIFCLPTTVSFFLSFRFLRGGDQVRSLFILA